MLYIVTGLNADESRNTSYHESYSMAVRMAVRLNVVYHYQSISIRRVTQ